MQTVPSLPLLAIRCVALLLLVSACGHPLPDMPGFDSAVWRNDPYGCQNRRQALLPILEQHRTVFYGARLNDITKVLGHPDEEELGEQSDKVYIYYVTAGMQCTAGHPRAARNRVILRSGATGTVTEVLLPVIKTDK